MVDASGIDGFLRIHAEVDHIDDCLKDGVDNRPRGAFPPFLKTCAPACDAMSLAEITIPVLLRIGCDPA